MTQRSVTSGHLAPILLDASSNSGIIVPFNHYIVSKFVLRNSFEVFNFDDVDFTDCTSSNALSQISNIVDERLPLKVYTLKSFLLRQKQTLRSIWMS